MAGVNKVILIGNIGKKETKTTSMGTKIVNISVATSYKKKDSNDEVTEWHNVVFFHKLADIADMYLTKGMKVYIEGQLKTDKWQTQSGETRYSTKVNALNMQMLDKKSDNENNNMQDDLPAAAAVDYQRAKDEPEFIEDDIPF